jgi:glycosyltransferase involved in cell wall biosynthesis
MSRDPIVSVNLPCYRQLPLAKATIASILAQDFADFELTLLDDGASDEYRDYAASLNDARVRYHRNPERLGAMRNMFAAIAGGRGRYSLAFHEDDLLEPGYLSAAAAVMDQHPTCGFVACQMREFDGTPPPAAAAAARQEWFRSPADLVRGICCGVEPMFGSVMYRRAALAGVVPQHALYATLVDRPFLLSILERWSGALLVEPPLAWYRRHGDGDDRHLAMTADHVLRLLETYRRALPAAWSGADQDLFYRYTGYWLPALFDLTPPAGRPTLRRFIYRAWRQGLYDPRRGRAYGRKRLLKAMLAASR